MLAVALPAIYRPEALRVEKVWEMFFGELTVLLGFSLYLSVNEFFNICGVYFLLYKLINFRYDSFKCVDIDEAN